MKNMEITDANYILKYLFKDNELLFKQASSILENKNVMVPLEVLAEVVCVFEKIYGIPRIKI